MTISLSPPSPGLVNPLSNYSLNGRSDVLAKLAQTQTPLLGGLAVKGQAGAWYAAPNGGKTLTALRLLQNDVAAGKLVGSDCYYVGADDSAAGALEKLKLLEPKDIQVLVPGFQDFQADHLPGLLRESIANGTAQRRFLILDTLKKFTNLMDKGESSRFASLVREFTMHGGSVLGLAHTNKRTDHNGNPIFGGTSDIRDDFDYVFTLKPSPYVDEGQTFIQADCIKSRGSVLNQALITYSSDSDLPYPDLMASLRLVGEDERKRFVAELEMQQNAEVVEAIAQSIRTGVIGKMAIAKSVAHDIGIGRHTVDRVIDKYTGNDPAKHHWTYNVGPRGVRTFRLLSDGSAVPDPEDVF